MSVATGLIRTQDVVRTVGPTLSPPTLDMLRESDARAAVTGRPDTAVLSKLRASGLLATAVPEAYGGAGGDAAAVNRVVAQAATVNPSVAIILFQHFAVCARIDEWGTDEQKARFLPALAAGEFLAASAWSETGAGAAKKRLASLAERLPGGRWLLNGAKSFTTGAGVADLYLVLVQTSTAQDDPHSSYGSAGQSFFLVRGDNPGLIPDPSLDLVGMRGSATGFVRLGNCEVTDGDRLGPLGQATALIAGVRESGATLGAVSAGIAQAAYDLAAEHRARLDAARAQAVRHQMVGLSTLLESAHAFVARAGHRASDDPGRTTLQAKLHASAAAEHMCLEVSRMLGSAGYVVDHRLNRLIADARAVALMGPTNELCRELVAQSWEK
ncbi:acyl-CoA dehydrogenase family protein [Streptomyces sp. NPDC001401]|uniref:acyl-CoA dehydrogenase family protein n=1 Tax=Streptomyces sp. NPDC001401 TaxID=3364570 RepID=UPI0036CC901F